MGAIIVRKLIQLPYSPWDIQPDTIIYSDLHLHERKEFDKIDPSTGLNSRFMEGLDILFQIYQIIEEHKEITWLINLGDLFELKDRIPNHLLLETKSCLDEISELGQYDRVEGLRHIHLIGNHDFNLPNYPIAELFKIDLINEPIIHDEIAFLPYQRSQEDFLKYWKELNSKNPDIFFFHQEIPGVEYETGRKVPGLFPISMYNEKTLYFSGHIHKSQKVGKVLYVGSPYQIRFSDENQNRYIWLLNRKTKRMAPLELKYSKFISINIRLFQAIISEGQPTWEELDNISGNYIRIIGEVEANLWTIQQKQRIKKILEEAGAKGISFQVKTKKVRQSRIPDDKVEDDNSIIRHYVENSLGESGLDKDKLTRVGIEIFHAN